MHISVTCENCHKHYRVEDKLAGRKVKCKACGRAIAIPAGPTPPVEDLLAGLNAAAAAEQGAPTRASTPSADTTPRPRPSPQPSVEPVEAPADYDLPPVPAPVPPRPVAPPSPVVSYELAEKFQRDHDNYRVNSPYASSILGSMESMTLFLTQAFFWFAFAITCLVSVWVLCVAIGASIQGKNVAWARASAIIFLPPLYFGFVYFLGASLNVLAVSLAGKALMFRLPDDENRWRVLGASIGAFLPQYCVFVVLFPILWAQDRSFANGFADAYGRSMALTILFFPVNIMLHFTFTWLLFRLRFLEAALTWIFLLIMNTLITFVIVLVIFVIAMAMR
jgi:predicted Zn finger-like uncharacterized protein